MTKKHIITILKILITILILFGIYKIAKLDFTKLFDYLKQVKISYFALSLLGIIVILGVKSIRWKLLLQSEGIKFSFFNSLTAYLASFSIGIITPGRLGEFVKIYYPREKNNAKVTPAFQATFNDRIFDLVFLIWSGITGYLYVFDILKIHYAIIISTTGLIILILLAQLFFKTITKKGKLKNNILLSFLKNSIETLLLNKYSIVYWSITFIGYLTFFYANFLIAKSLEINISYLNLSFIISLTSLVLLLPISIAGFGTREASLIFLFSFFQINSESAIAYSVLQFFSFFVWGGIAGILFWLIEPIPIKTLRKDANEIKKRIFGSKQKQTTE